MQKEAVVGRIGVNFTYRAIGQADTRVCRVAGQVTEGAEGEVGESDTGSTSFIDALQGCGWERGEQLFAEPSRQTAKPRYACGHVSSTARSELSGAFESERLPRG